MAKFCQNCGKELTGNESVCSDCGSNVKSTSISNNSGAPIVQKREIVVSIILSFVTCGLYGLYWIICMNNDANKVSGENTPTGGVVIISYLWIIYRKLLFNPNRLKQICRLIRKK